MSNEKNNDLHYLMGTNMISYVKMMGFKEVNVEFTENGRVKYWFLNCDDLHKTIRRFKNDVKIQNFLKYQNEIKEKIIELRTNNN